MAKKNTSIWIEPHVQRGLKELSVRWGKPLGGVIEGLVDFARMAETAGDFIKEPEIVISIQGLFENAMTNAGSKALRPGVMTDAEIREWILDGRNESDLDATAKGELERAIAFIKGKK